MIGRPDRSGGSQASARICVICSGVNFPGLPLRGASASRSSMARRKAACVSVHSIWTRLGQALTQRRRYRPTAVASRSMAAPIARFSSPSKARKMISAR